MSSLHGRSTLQMRDPVRPSAIDDLPSAIDALLQENRIADAARLARSCLDEGLLHPKLFHLAAFALEQDGRYDEALAVLGRGLELAPADADLVLATGFCLLQLQRLSEALAIFRHALTVDPGAAVAQFGLGLALRGSHSLDEARVAFERAVTLDPRHARAWSELGGVYEMQGRRDEALALVQRALSLDADDFEAKCVSAKLALAEGDFIRAERMSRECLRVQGVGPGKTAELRFLNADALDGLGRTREAFAGYLAAKSDLKARYARVFDTTGQPTAFDAGRRVLDDFVKAPAEAWAAPEAAAPADAPAANAFLFGFPRSGTTLLENVLASHPGIASLEERPTLHGAAAVFLAPGGLARLAKAKSSDFGVFRADYWRRMREFGMALDGRLVIDKQPLGVFLLPVVAKLFPGAKVLCPIRDPRDVVLSCFRRDFVMSASIYEFTTLDRAARYYDLAMQSWEAFRAALPIETHEVRLEDLVRDFDGEVRTVCRFLGVEWNEAMYDFAATARTRGVRSRSAGQVVDGLNTRGVAQWRRYEAELKPVLPLLEPWVERFGYADA